MQQPPKGGENDCCVNGYETKVPQNLREKLKFMGSGNNPRNFNINSWVVVSSSHFIMQYLEFLHLKFYVENLTGVF